MRVFHNIRTNIIVKTRILIQGRNCIDKPSNDRLRNVKESFKRYYHKELKENMIKMGGYLSQIDQFDA